MEIGTTFVSPFAKARSLEPHRICLFRMIFEWDNLSSAEWNKETSKIIFFHFMLAFRCLLLCCLHNAVFSEIYTTQRETSPLLRLRYILLEILNERISVGIKK